MYIIFLISVFGLAASMVAHFSTFFGVNPQRIFPGVWLLHVILFVVFIPTIVYCGKDCKKVKREDHWKVVTANAPGWMKWLTAFLFVYALFNFFFTIFVMNEGGGPGKIDGRKVLHDHGKIIRELTDEEYEQHQAYEVRTASGHWMVFYAVCVTLLYSKLKGDRDKKIEPAPGEIGF